MALLALHTEAVYTQYCGKIWKIVLYGRACHFKNSTYTSVLRTGHFFWFCHRVHSKVAKDICITMQWLSHEFYPTICSLIKSFQFFMESKYCYLQLRADVSWTPNSWGFLTFPKLVFRYVQMPLPIVYNINFPDQPTAYTVDSYFLCGTLIWWYARCYTTYQVRNEKRK